MKEASVANIFRRYNQKRKSFILRLLETIIYSVIFIVFIGLIYQFVSGKIDDGKYKMKGSYVSAGSFRVMANTAGSGKYTVVFESDTGMPIQDWDKVKNNLSENYNVFTYDRAGFGWSDASDKEPSIDTAVDTLRKALLRMGITGPYILVGHGYGGLIMSEYAQEYHDDVAGVVLVDSLVESDIESQKFQKSLSKQLTQKGIGKIFSYIGGVRLAYQLNLFKNNEHFLDTLASDEKALFKAQRVQSKYYSAFVNELKTLKDYKGSIQQKGILGDEPVLVLSPSEKYEDGKKNKDYIELQKSLLNLSSDSEQMVIENSGSFIQIDRPETIVKAVDAIAKKANKKK